MTSQTLDIRVEGHHAPRDGRWTTEGARTRLKSVSGAGGLTGWAGGSAAMDASARRLTNEELVERYQEGDVRSLDRLLEANEGLLHHALKRFSWATEPYEDLFQLARLALMKAAQRFDLARGHAFTTYAIAIVDGEVRHHLRDSLLVRQPRWAHALYSRIQDARSAFFQEHHRSPSIAELAEKVNIQAEGVLEIIRVHGGTTLHSLDEPLNGSDDEALDKSLVRSIRSESFSLPIEDRILLYDAVRALSDLQKRIIYLVFFGDLTQQQVADEMGMTQRGVSREQIKALERLKAILHKKLF